MTREQLFKLKPKVEEVPVPNYGTFHLRGITMDEAMVAEEAAKKAGDEKITGYYLIAARLCDEKGNLILSEPGDAKKVGGLPSPIVMTLLDKINDKTPKSDVEKATQAKN